MRWKIHQQSWIEGQLFGPDEPNQGIFNAAPLAHRGQKITRRVVGKSPETVTLGEDLHHTPGPHWEPLDDEAREHCKKLGHRFTGETPDVLIGLEEQLAMAQSAMLHPNTASDIGRAIVEGLKDAGLLIAPGRVQAAAPPAQKPARQQQEL